MDLYSYRIEIWQPMADAQSATPPPEIVGFAVEASDGHIGKVDEASTEPGSSCVVVDTGFWIFGKKRMIPAAMVDRIDRDDEKVYLSLRRSRCATRPTTTRSATRRTRPRTTPRWVTTTAVGPVRPDPP